MKPRILLYALIGLLVMALVIIIRYPAEDPEPATTFSATVNQDCAPWDGGAFTILIPYDAAATIQVSIWESTANIHSTTFSFPDDSGRVGHAQLLSSGPLSGTVFIRDVQEGSPIRGAFDLTTENGSRLRGNFIATWGDFVALCG